MAPPVLHRLVITRAGEARVLAVAEGEAWRLPEVKLDERHTAEVEHVNAEARERWGLETVVLCGLEHVETARGARRTHALDVWSAARERRSSGLEQSGADAPHSRWLAPEELGVFDAEEAALTRRWLDTIGTDAPDGCGWMRPGWWTAVRAWIDDRLGAAEIVQTRAWQSSCVARVRWQSADFFLKALPISAAREARLTAFLSAGEVPGAPRVAAVDLKRRWILMHAFDGKSLDDSRDPGDWARGVATYGRLQASTLGRAAELRDLGCDEQRLDDLASALASLADDVEALTLGKADGGGAKRRSSFDELPMNRSAKRRSPFDGLRTSGEDWLGTESRRFIGSPRQPPAGTPLRMSGENELRMSGEDERGMGGEDERRVSGEDERRVSAEDTSEAQGLSAAEVAVFRALVPGLARGCEALAAAEFPLALDHGDFWPSNILVNEGDCTIIDWEDARLCHPFLGLAPFLAMVREWRVPLSLDDVADAYLPPFAVGTAMSDLRPAFAAAAPLGLAEMAVRYWRMPPAVTDLHPWMREMVPFFLRHLLAFSERTAT